MWGRLLFWVAAGLAAALSLSGVAQARSEPPPNIVLITSDDQPLSTFQRRYMPATFRRLVDHGTSFTDAVVNVPLCCPSRATLLTGQYPHNHGVLTNSPGYGALRERRNVLPVWLRRAGYRTGHFGKWLHGYEKLRGTSPAPGWSSWLTQLNRRRYYDYKLSRDGRVINKGERRRDHVVSVMTRASSRFVRHNVRRRRPLYLQLDYFAPHVGPRFQDGSTSRCIGAPEPERRDKRAFPSVSAPRIPSFDEEDVSDKPEFSRLPPLDEGQIASLDRRYRCTLESVAGVDRGVKRILREFRRAHELRNTAFVFLTDNGYFFGEHRIRGGKARPWEEAIRTPLVLRLPRGRRGADAVVDVQVAEVDIVPTILRLAGAQPCRRRCRVLDGRSLLAPAHDRTAAFEDRAVLVEMADPSTAPRRFACEFRALRTADDVLIRNSSVPDPDHHVCEDRVVYEHYAIDADPFQLENAIGASGMPSTLEEIALSRRLDRLRSCSGIAGRDPRSKGGYCE